MKILQSILKCDWCSLINQTYENKDIHHSEVAYFLEDVIIAEFNCDIQDGSLEQIGEEVCKFWRICSTGDEDSIQTKLQRYLLKINVMCYTYSTISSDVVYRNVTCQNVLFKNIVMCWITRTWIHRRDLKISLWANQSALKVPQL